MRSGKWLLAAAVVLALGACSTVPPLPPEPRMSTCQRDVVNGRLPSWTTCPGPEEEAEYEREKRRKQQTAEALASLNVISDYFGRNPGVIPTGPCSSLVDTSSPSIGECHRNVQAMDKIDGFFKVHPNLPRPKPCALPLSPDSLDACEAELRHTREPRPPGEWHRLIRDAVGCYRLGVFSDGNLLGTQQGCTEVHAGDIFLLQPVEIFHEASSNAPTYSAPLSAKLASASWNGIDVMRIQSDAFDPQALHCKATRVLLHYEVSCVD